MHFGQLPTDLAQPRGELTLPPPHTQLQAGGCQAGPPQELGQGWSGELAEDAHGVGRST